MDNNAIKYQNELNYWMNRYFEENKVFQNSHYKKTLLAMAKEPNDDFLKDKIVVDFGCGPRGSLTWTNSPKLKIGVDVLVDYYFDLFGEEMISDGYPYVKSTEKYIPLPSDFVDVVFTMNAMDHTENFEVMLSEIFRILKPGGIFIGSFNMNEPASPCEPQTLTFEIMKKLLYPNLDIQYKEIAFKGNNFNPKKGTYDCFYEPDFPKPSENDTCILWIRGKKKMAAYVLENEKNEGKRASLEQLEEIENFINRASKEEMFKYTQVILEKINNIFVQMKEKPNEYIMPRIITIIDYIRKFMLNNINLLNASVISNIHDIEKNENNLFNNVDMGVHEAFEMYSNIFYKREKNSNTSLHFLAPLYESLLYKLKNVFQKQKQRTLDLLPSLKPLIVKNSPRYIVTLTSYGKRLMDVPYTIITLINQSVQPDLIVLWVAHEDRENLSPLMPELIEKGVIVRFCDNMKSHKKLIYSLIEYPNDILITADDDVYYPENWLEQLIIEHKRFPNKIICHFARRISFNENSTEENIQLANYKDWDVINKSSSNEKEADREGYYVFPIGIGGILYPPRCLHPDTINKNLINNLSPKSDDVWFWAMAIRNSKFFEGKSSYRVIENGYNTNFKYIDPEQQFGDNTNMTYNNFQGGKNNALHNVIEHFPELKEYMHSLIKGFVNSNNTVTTLVSQDNYQSNDKIINNKPKSKSNITMQTKVHDLQNQGFNCDNFITPKKAKQLNLNEIHFCYGGMGDGLMQKQMAEIYYQKTGKRILLAVNHPEFFVNSDEFYVLNELYGREIKNIAIDAIKHNTEIVYLDDVPFRFKLITGIVYKESEKRVAYKEWPTNHFVAQATSYLGISGEIIINPILKLNETEKVFGRFSKDKKQIAIMNQGTQFYKSLPIETTQNIIDSLKHKYTFVQIGAENDPPLKNIINLQGKISLRETASVLHNSELFVGSIGGLMHLARCVGCRSVIAYSNEPLAYEYYEGNSYVFSDTPCFECAENRLRVPFDDCPFNYKCINGINAVKMVSVIDEALYSNKTLLPQKTFIQANKINGLELLKISIKVVGYNKGLVKKEPTVVLSEAKNLDCRVARNDGSVKTNTYTSYSADFEDFILDTMFSHIKEGFYIDVGANSPWLLSATKNLYDRGWTGINIEPLLECFNDLQAERIRDINLNCGCGSSEGKTTLLIDAPKNNWTGGLSSCSQETINNPNWKLYNSKNALEKRTITIKKLTDICNEYKNRINQRIHLLKIDVEGAEKDVLLGFDFAVRPWIISLESTEPCTDIPTFQKWEYLLTNKGYRFIFQYKVNRFYIDSRNVEDMNMIIRIY